MRVKTFFGGIHPKYEKEGTAGSPIEILPAPETLVVSMDQHTGAPATPVVAKGDEVRVGQMIGEAAHGISAPVHSPVSGKVIAVESRLHPCGTARMAVVIENDGQDEWVERETHADPVQLDRETILQKIKDAGIVGMGGGGFPAAVKLSPPKNAVIDYLILNGSECEPYLTADHRVMVEYPDDVILGAKLMAKVCGARQIIIAVEDNKPDAISALQERSGAIKIVPVATKYPQGGEKQLIKAVTGREVPSKGLPFQAGAVVHNVSTALAVTKAVRDGEPSIMRVVTVTGSIVREPKNLLVPVGTPFEYLFEAAGGFSEKPGKVLVGGPMMGVTQIDLTTPIVKTVTGLVAISQAASETPEYIPCIKCARCVDVCPANLLPLRLEAFGMNEMWDEADEYGALDCIECGCCSYICPSKRPLLQYIRSAKREIAAANRRKSS